LKKLLEAAPDVQVDYVDLSPRMLELAQSRAGCERVRYHHADALTWPITAEKYDLIVTHFFLDCLNESHLAQLVRRIGTAARPGAQWIVSEFREAGPVSGAYIRALYLFFAWTTRLKTRQLTNHHAYFSRDGFRPVSIQSTWKGLLTSELWVLDSL
jgi:ubiquinone/menaquinone biosynthesis C-methylase UbiE